MGDFFNMSIRIPLIWDLVGLLEFCIVFVYIHEKPLPLFPAIPIFSTPEEIHCGLIKLLIVDPAKTAYNCFIIDKFEHKFRILNNISGKVFFLLLFQTRVLTKSVFQAEIFFCLKNNNRLLLVVSVFASWLFDFIRY